MAKTFYRKSLVVPSAGAAVEEGGAILLSGGVPQVTVKSTAGNIPTAANNKPADILPFADPTTANAASLLAGTGATWFIRLDGISGIFAGATLDDAWVAFALKNGIVAADLFVECIPVT